MPEGVEYCKIAMPESGRVVKFKTFSWKLLENFAKMFYDT